MSDSDDIDDQMIVTLTVSQLRVIIRETVKQELAALQVREPDEWLLIREAAERLHFSIRHVRNLISDGRLEARRPGGPGGKILVKASSVTAYRSRK